MATLSTGMLIVLLVTASITTLAMLSVFANVIGHETQLHDLRNRVKDLHFQHTLYLARMNGEVADEQPIEIEPDPTPSPATDPDQSDLPEQPLDAQSLPDATESPSAQVQAA